MMNLRALRYTAVLSGLVFAIISFTSTGILTFALPLYIFLVIPLLEFILPADGPNFSEQEEDAALKDPLYDYVLYAMVPIIYAVLIFAFFSLGQPELAAYEIAGRIFSLGLIIVSVGINVGHELGHRSTWYEKFMAKALLLTSLNLHFIIEHNRGHHKRVSTDEDPASSRYGESLYVFWIRSWLMGYISAWKLESKRLRKKGLAVISIHNEMIRFEIIQILFVLAVSFFFGWIVAVYFIIAAAISKLLLETINYVEHYGLRRRKKENGYERVLPVHSWNSNQAVGRVMLFELTRHSDHHFKASRKYQILRHYEEVPQMPAGYPTMILLSFIPPLWFYVMHRQIRKFKEENAGGVALG